MTYKDLSLKKTGSSSLTNHELPLSSMGIKLREFPPPPTSTSAGVLILMLYLGKHSAEISWLLALSQIEDTLSQQTENLLKYLFCFPT